MWSQNNHWHQETELMIVWYTQNYAKQITPPTTRQILLLLLLYLIHSVSFLQFLSDLSLTAFSVSFVLHVHADISWLSGGFQLLSDLNRLTPMSAPPFTALSRYRTITHPPPIHDAMSLHTCSSWRDDLSSAWMLGVVYKQSRARIKRGMGKH